VVQGEVAVHGRAGPADAAFDVRLPAGSFGVYGPAGAKSRSEESGEIERTLSWRYGTISLSGQTLREAAAEFNRYNTKRLVVADPTIADLRFGGYFRETDVDGFARALQTSFGIQATDTGSAIYLSRAAAPQRTPAS
jgi:transmembrane sensor